MKIFILLILSFNVKFSFSALECMGCEVTSPDDKCDFFYKCKKGIEMCETLVSKVNGNYSIVMSCATKENCGHDQIYNEGFEECRHKKTDTECYSCCDHDRCNSLENALKKLPKNTFAIAENESKISKIIEDDLENLEKGEEIYDEESVIKKPAAADYDDVVDENQEEDLKKKPFKTTTEEEADYVEVTTSGKKITTPRVDTQKTTDKITSTIIDKITSTLAKNSTISPKTNQSEVVVVPKINIDGTQIAFMPNATNSTKIETTTERELEINDIADFMFPRRENKTAENDSDDDDELGEHDKLFDESGEKGAAGGNLKLSFAVLIVTFIASFMI